MTRNNPPVRSSFNISFSIILLVKEDFPMKERAKKEVNVMTPIPPICIKIMMIICPICVKLVATSTGVSPVTHTEVVEINKASINGIRCVVAFGNDSNPAPTNITNTKLSKKSNEGLIRVCISVNVCRDK